MDAFLGDLRRSVRTFARTPGFAIAAISTLALGIAANTAIFSVANAVLLKPFGYADPARIVMFQNTFRDGTRSGSAAPVEFNWWRRQTGAFQDVSAYAFNAANFTGESAPEQIPTMLVSADFFRLCGASAIAGREFTAADDQPKAPKTTVLAYSFWLRQFGGDFHAIGRRIELNGERYQIIGVLGPQNNQIAEQSLLSGDIEIDSPPDAYLPFQLDPLSAERGHYFNVAGRLKPGIALAAATAQLESGYAEYARQWTDLTPGASFGAQPLREAVVGGVRNSLLILLAAVGFVLLIACANAANLQLARAAGRKREFAIRAAVGAGRGSIIRQLLTESAVLSLAGGIVGLAAGYVGIRALLTLSPVNIPRIGAGGSGVGLDWRVAGFTFALSLLTAVLFGLVPALQLSRRDLSGALKESGGPGGTGVRHNGTRALLNGAEMALAVVLLIGAALLIRSFISLRQVNPGFDARNILTMRTSLVGPQFATAASVTRAIDEGIRRIRALPGVDMAASTCCMPLEDRLHGTFQIVGRGEGPDSQVLTGWAVISPGYFETFKIPVLAGRAFTQRDETGPPVVVINRTLAKTFWPNSDPLKDRIVFTGGGSPRQIVGVVEDVREDALSRAPRPNVYLLANQMTGTELLQTLPWVWAIRTRGAPMPLSAAIQNELREATGGLPIASVRTMDEILAGSTGAERFRTFVLTIFGCAALLLAGVGIYGSMAHSVAQRRQEIGIRLALGADSSHVRNMVALQGARPALVGVICGIATALGLARLIAGLLFDVEPWDPLVFIAAPATSMVVALVAVWLPAERASRADPIAALRRQ